MNRFLSEEDSICAISTPPGRGGIGVVRLSGDGSEKIIRNLAAFLPESLESHRIYYGILKDQGNSVDEVLVSAFLDGRGFTGETCFEISFHGNPIIGQSILNALVSHGARVAGPGEFTYRAFMNGRIDLTQAEAVQSLIESRSDRATSQALRQLQGDLKDRLLDIEEDLTVSMAHMEANLDFAAEDIVIEKDDLTLKRLSTTQDKLSDLVKGYRRGRLLSAGFKVAILGAPNVGKSSLLNRVLGQERAIVTDVPGTTRDVVTGEISLDGFLVSFSDTAGIRSTDDQVEQMGIKKSRAEGSEADLIWFVDEVGEEALPEESWPKEKVLRVRNKADLGQGEEGPLYVSAHSGKGIDRLLEDLRQRLIEQGEESAPALMQARHYELLTGANQDLCRGIELLAQEESPEFVLAEIGSALKNVMEVLGKRFDDEVMDRVFKEFCLGK